MNVVLFIETGLELHQGHDLFAVLAARINELITAESFETR